MRRTHLLELALFGPLVLVACNRPPTEPVIRLEPDAPTTVDDLRLVIVTETTDPDGDEIGHNITWTVDGDAQPARDFDRLVRAADTEKGQVWEVQVVGWDGLDFSAEVTASVTVVNSLPVAEVRIEPGDPSNSDDLVAVVDVSDADGDPVTLDFSWTKNGTAVSNATNTVLAAETSKGEAWRVEVVPDDGEAAGAMTSAAVSIGNQAPSVAAARVDPGTLYTWQTASCVGAAWKDADGDPEMYLTEWLVNDVVVAETETLDGLVYFDRDDVVQCRLTPFDDVTEGEPVTSFGVTVRNALPVVVDLVVEPDPPRTNDTIEATPTMVDGDGDMVVARYSWLVEGDEVSTASFLRGTEHFDKGDVIELEVRPFDGIQLQGPTRWSATVENTPPTAPTVSISPSAPGPSDDLTCEIDAESVDDDGDVVTYTYEWLVNAKNTAVGKTLSASFTSSGDIVQCRAIPNDGEEDGPLGSATVTLP